MSYPLILDTGGWLMALAGEKDFVSAVEDASALYIPGLVLTEVDYHLRHRRLAMARVLRDILEGDYLYEPPTLADLSRASEIDAKFGSVKLGLVDASVAALAERLNVMRVLTVDSDFYAVRVGRQWERALELVVPPRRKKPR